MAGINDPLEAIKLMTKTVVDGFVDNLVENKVVNKRTLQNLGSGISNFIEGTESLIEKFTEKNPDKIYLVVGNPKKQLSLKFVTESDDDEPDKEFTLLTIDSEDESEDENGNEESNESAQAQGFSPTESNTTGDVLKLCPSAHFYEMKTKRADEIYPVMEKKGRTRLALIINNKEFEYLNNRNGSEIDLWGMEALLEELGYSVIIKENLTAVEMKEELRQFAARKEHQASDSTFLVFMSHGVQKGICGINHKEDEPDILPDDVVFQTFNNRNCKNLRDKPKIIINQACRGNGKGMVWVPDQAEDSACRRPRKPSKTSGMALPIQSDAVIPSHVERDFIAFRSCTLHNISMRLDKGGSLFISQLIRCIKAYSWCCHLEEIFRKVQNSFETPSELAQMPTIDRVTLTRYFYLFPGN